MPRILFLHPDLGIGGAERLVVDAALALKKRGNVVNIVTTHHDKSHAFEETVNGELAVTVVGDWIPRSIFNRFYALMAYIRMIYAALYVILIGDFKADVAFCDLVSVAVPVLKLKINHVVFYCHYPDQLLSVPQGRLKGIYRAPINWLEEVSTARATKIFVNSNFTAGVFKATFKTITKTPEILYPSLNMNFFDSHEGFLTLPKSLDRVINDDSICFLSINRYERKKNLTLALEGMASLKACIDSTAWSKVHLVLAGGYDTRVNENVQHYDELVQARRKLDLEGKVTFLRSMSDAEKIALLNRTNCLLYTPSNEHFGIVPIEAMYMEKPVIAVNSGGPTETVVNGETGFLCEPTPESFSSAMRKFVEDGNLSSRMGSNGRKRIIELFSFDEFASKLNGAIDELVNKKDR